MRFTLGIICGLGITLASGAVWAQSLTYVPFNFHNKDLYQRPDIKDVIPPLKVTYPASNNLNFGSYSSVGTTVYLRQEVFQVLEAYERTQDPTPVSPFPNYTTCRAHNTLSSLRASDVIRSIPQCEGLKSQLVNLQSQTFNGCELVNQPERRLLEHVPGKVHYKKVQNLRGLLETAGHGLFQVPQVAKMLPLSHASTLRSALRKIYIQDFSTRISAQTNSVLAFQNALSRNLSCTQGNNTLAQVLGQVLDESKIAQGKLTQEYQAGLAQAQADREAVLRQGYRRDKLEEPYLTDQDRKILSMYIGAIMWRIRGGGLTQQPDGTLNKRMLGVYYPFNYLSKLSGGEAGGDQGTSLLYAVTRGWGRWFDMGRTPTQEDIYHDLVYMTRRGNSQVVGSVNDLEGRRFDASFLHIAGLQMGPCYFYSWEKYEGKTLGRDLQPPFAGFIDGPTALGELCVGANLGLSLSETLLKGYRQ